MKKTAFLIKNANTPHVKEGIAMQLQFEKDRYIFLTGYSGLVSGVTEDLISNLATIPTHAKEADDLVQIRDDIETRGVLMKWKGRGMKAADAFDEIELDYMSSRLGMDATRLSYNDLRVAVSAELLKYRNGESGFTDRLVPAWKGKTTCKYTPIDVPADFWFDETPESLKGFGHYELAKGDSGIVLRDGKPADHGTLIYELPGIDRNFADYAGRQKITYI